MEIGVRECGGWEIRLSERQRVVAPPCCPNPGFTAELGIGVSTGGGRWLLDFAFGRPLDAG